MVSQEDWEPMLPSMLFALRVSRHSSTGLSPHRVLYQRDPILPFQYMDRANNGGLDSANDCLNIPYNGENDDPVWDLVDKLEKIWKNSGEQVSHNIKKAQKHQAKNYNARHRGTPFKGLYQITNILSSGLYFLKDKYSHQLKRPIPQIIW